MMPFGHDIAQRQQNERPLVHAGMGHLNAALLDQQIIPIGNQIKINHPCFVSFASNATKFRLDMVKTRQKIMRTQSGFKPRNAVDIPRLIRNPEPVPSRRTGIRLPQKCRHPRSIV